MSTGASPTPPADEIELWTLRGLIASHKLAALVVAALIAAAVAFILVATLASKAGAVTDYTTCTQWGSATQNTQTAYAERYLREHGGVPRYGSSPAAVIDAINFGCGEAFGDSVSDTTTVVQAISGNF